MQKTDEGLEVEAGYSTSLQIFKNFPIFTQIGFFFKGLLEVLPDKLWNKCLKKEHLTLRIFRLKKRKIMVSLLNFFFEETPSFLVIMGQINFEVEMEN